jgi:hypothetical protein
MRYAVIADIHANLEAFKAVLADIERRGGVMSENLPVRLAARLVRGQ